MCVCVCGRLAGSPFFGPPWQHVERTVGLSRPSPSTLLSLSAPVSTASGELGSGAGHSHSSGSLKRGVVPPASLLGNGSPVDSPPEPLGRPLAGSVPGSPSASAPPPLADFPSPGEPRKYSLQTEKKPSGFLVGFKKTLRSRKTETSLLYTSAEVRTG